MPRLITRRKLLLGLGASSLLAGCQSAPARVFLTAMTAWNQRAEELLFSQRRLAPSEPESALTPLPEFPVHFISPMIPYAPDNWSLKVEGLVVHPRTFSLAELKRIPRTDTRVRHHCVEGWSAAAAWSGVQVREIARIVGAHRDARFVEFRSFDSGYWSSWDCESAFHPQTLLAYGMNGDDLHPDHGRQFGSIRR